MWASPDIAFRGLHLYSPRFEKPLVFSPWAMESSVEATVDCPEIKVESPEEPLLILEEGDEPSDLIINRERGRTVLRVKKSDEDEIDDTVREDARDHNNVQREKHDSEVTEAERNEEGGVNPGGQRERKVDGCENITKMDERLCGGTRETAVKMPQEETQEPEETNTDMSTRDKPTAQADVKLRPKDRLRPDDAKQTRISDSPDALCELLYALQEGRRFNDQRCSFQLERRRRCYSEPSTPRHSQRVVFSSMTSLQKDEFFDLLETSQGRRLNDQRAELQDIPSVPPPPKPKQRKGSCKVTEVSRTVPTQTPKEDLYNMIVVSQGQGRIEEQRCSAPGPMDDEDFFSLLLKVQGGRMDEQRTDLKPAHL
ncbi:G-protein-signaling modulator 1 [Triplophysa rosa]|uniref:G-protein-signaling modulator 1 n=1 Tax=Triplophysa rosa TaxID=992332 RepID=A0A9W7WQ36_TRIRA|nr:G-protein-signaling modulator 1 [Triplophysa rosa]KAI7806274.1 hypothetical protein IRJ41_003125 [Triplophysa rosa]